MTLLRSAFTHSGHEKEPIDTSEDSRYVYTKLRDVRRKNIAAIRAIVAETNGSIPELCTDLANFLSLHSSHGINPMIAGVNGKADSILNVGFRNSDAGQVATGIKQDFERYIGERNDKIPTPLQQAIEESWGIYYGNQFFDYWRQATGKWFDLHPSHHTTSPYPVRLLCSEERNMIDKKGRLVVYRNYTTFDALGEHLDNSEKNQYGYSANLHGVTLHPQTIRNLIGNGGLVDIIELQSTGYKVGVSRLHQALQSLNISMVQRGLVNFPYHRGDDGQDYDAEYTGLNVDGIDIVEGIGKPPLILVQEDYGKGKYYSCALDKLKELGIFAGRSVFIFTRAFHDAGSEGTHGNTDLMELSFIQISRKDWEIMSDCNDNRDILPMLDELREDSANCCIDISPIEIHQSASKQLPFL